ncbi:hypothetical protein OESDEN_14908 [Oesophagostomum dentatum]|uniref:C2H2-type domain-containing protein n=1 Tax=Oesophagostomum dentatum TaxID=61180 RepID=A0A0B1SKB0_OESDE|nr:hypothetical protein OESDEN_14908 [Oesophagostomum dentatum]
MEWGILCRIFEVKEVRRITRRKESYWTQEVFRFHSHVVALGVHMVCGGAVVIPTSVQSTLDLDLPPLPPRPTDPAEIRKIVRSKMIRCKVCGNRFGQRNLLERHLRDKHHVEYLEYLYQEELEVQRQREEELERNRIDELTSGGFIPPQSAIESNSYEVDVKEIPLPGELSNGIVARFDANGYLRQPKRTFRKKVSPQCPFCDKRFRNEVSLKKHFVKKHPECVEFVQCLDCFKCLPDKTHLPNHECDMTWLCYECSPIQNMCTEQRFTNHRAKFHRGANSGFRCNECNQKFLTPRKLRVPEMAWIGVCDDAEKSVRQPLVCEGRI